MNITAVVSNLIAPAPSPAPGLLAPCDPLADCLPYGNRFQYSLDFLCCEQYSGWVAAHVTNPLGVSFFLDSFALGLAVAFWFEAFEITVLTLFTSFIIFETRELELETWAGSVLGDALIQGALGSLLGFLLRWAFDVTGPLRNWRLMSGWLRVKYIAFWVLYSASFILLTFVGDNGVNYGLFAATGVQALLLLLVFPLGTQSAADEAIVWQQRDYRYKRVTTRTGAVVEVLDSVVTRRVPRARRWALFVAWFLINATLAAQSTGLPLWFANTWYQVWLATGFIIVALVAIGLIRRQKPVRVAGKRR